MALLTLFLGLIPFALGLGALAMSVDLVPTEMGRLYAESGVFFLSSSFVVFAVAALIHRIDRISAPRKRAEAASAPAPELPASPAPEGDEINLNRSGHLPSLHAVEEALAEPEPGPQIIGRYNAGGARYVVYSDGTIEAETDEGGLRFASMEAFKAYVAARQS